MFRSTIPGVKAMKALLCLPWQTYLENPARQDFGTRPDAGPGYFPLSNLANCPALLNRTPAQKEFLIWSKCSIESYQHFRTIRPGSPWGTVGGAAQSFSLFTLEIWFLPCVKEKESALCLRW